MTDRHPSNRTMIGSKDAFAATLDTTVAVTFVDELLRVHRAVECNDLTFRCEACGQPMPCTTRVLVARYKERERGSVT
jgi:hypothetical protein